MKYKLVYGIHTINTILKNNHNKLIDIYYSSYNYRLKKIIRSLQDKNIRCRKVSNKWLNCKTNNALHQGILAKIHNNQKKNERYLFNLIKKDNLFLIIDSIKDPRNLGSCLRCAEAAKVDAVILSYRNNAPINSTAIKVACGATELLKIIYVKNINQIIKKLKEYNIWMIGAVCNSGTNIEYIYKVNLNKSIALIIGSEENGIRKLIKEHCDQLINIPMLGKISSLNTSVATGICLFEIIRQKKFNYIN